MKAAILAMALCAFATGDAGAQYGGGRHGGGPRNDSQQQGEQKGKCSEMPDDPFAAVERELPSLSLDVGLTAVQVEAWNAFARDVRDIAEMGRTRRRHVMAIRDDGDPPATALAVVRTLSEDDRMRADATRDLQKHVEALYSMFSDAQRRVFDKRLILSQTDPLGK
ncbi:MAG TPA: Spy/CpxP family protein refolding chaperone [Usitatibacter sp.]|nr:Spy/CpxP family protein refolding chaperone [Usitatibacter sp.]